MVRFLKHSWPWDLCIVRLVVISSAAWYIVGCCALSGCDGEEHPSSWRGITPGQTTLEEAETLLGAPDFTEKRQGYQVYGYEGRAELGWHNVELWAAEREGQEVLIGVLRVDQYLDEGTDRYSLADIQNLEQLVTPYGRPEQVTWSNYCQARHLVWAQNGIASTVDSHADPPEWSNFFVQAVLIFEPMSVRQFMRTRWPWPQYGPVWSHQNPCDETDVLDALPEDPYDWEHVPSSP